MSNPLILNTKQCNEWMQKLLNRAKLIGNFGEVPVCAIILDKEGKCIGYGSNSREKKKDPLGHAELIALRQASAISGEWRFNDSTLIVTLEPCQMCSAALIQARMGQVIFGASDKKRGGLGGAIDLSTDKSAHHKMIVYRGIMKKEAETQLKEWFKQLRNRPV